MSLVVSVADEMVVKAAGRGSILILVPATFAPYCAQSRSSVAVRPWRTAMMVFCYRLHVRNTAHVWRSQVMNARASDLSNSTGYARTHPVTRHLTQLQVSDQESCLVQSSYPVTKTLHRSSHP